MTSVKRTQSILRNTFETTTGLAAACDRGRAWPSRSRTQAVVLGGAKRKAEDAEMRSRHVRHPGVRGREAGRLVPDAPVTSFSLNLLGAKKGLIVNNTDICRHLGPAVVQLEGQNGRSANQNVKLGTPCGNARHKRHLARTRAVR